MNVKPNQRILEIGTGSGYQACILYLLGAKVYSIERIPQLYEQSKEKFKTLGYNINLKLGDGTLGWREFSPYNGIIVTAAAPKIPDTLVSQLAVGGKLIIPTGDKDVQMMKLIERISENDYREQNYDSFRFVPLIGKEGWEK
jgi:protein-L-isoaspartate(D-aspartate) O-methyltransferase